MQHQSIRSHHRWLKMQVQRRLDCHILVIRRQCDKQSCPLTGTIMIWLIGKSMCLIFFSCTIQQLRNLLTRYKREKSLLMSSLILLIRRVKIFKVMILISMRQTLVTCWVINNTLWFIVQGVGLCLIYHHICLICLLYWEYYVQ